MDSLYPGWSFYLEDKKVRKKVSKTFKILILVISSYWSSSLLFMAKSRNPIARILKYFTPKRFKDKTKYNRKLDEKIWKKRVQKGVGDQD